MFKGRPYNTCYLGNIDYPWEINTPAEAFDPDEIHPYVAEKPNPHYNPNSIFSYKCTSYTVERIETPDGKIAFPVYQITPYYEEDEPYKSREGEYCLAGWVVIDKDPFEKYRVADKL